VFRTALFGPNSYQNGAGLAKLYETTPSAELGRKHNISGRQPDRHVAAGI
jgi:hypothetical protein